MSMIKFIQHRFDKISIQNSSISVADYFVRYHNSFNELIDRYEIRLYKCIACLHIVRIYDDSHSHA